MLFRPDVMVEAVHEVTLELLGDYSVRAVMVDLDDTLVASGANLLDPRFRAWVAGLKEAKIPLLILSNGERVRVKRWSAELGVAGLSLVGKPFAPAFRRGLRLLGRQPGETAMIGDQLFTDVLGANLVGMVSILVVPLSTGGLPHTRVARRLEKLVLSKRADTQLSRRTGTQMSTWRYQLGGDRGGFVHR